MPTQNLCTNTWIHEYCMCSNFKVVSVRSDICYILFEYFQAWNCSNDFHRMLKSNKVIQFEIFIRLTLSTIDQMIYVCPVISVNRSAYTVESNNSCEVKFWPLNIYDKLSFQEKQWRLKLREPNLAYIFKIFGKLIGKFLKNCTSFLESYVFRN